MIIEKSQDFNIELNARGLDGRTGFHLVCQSGLTKTIECMIDNSVLFGIDLTIKDIWGRSGFQLAVDSQQENVINLIKRKMPNIAV